MNKLISILLLLVASFSYGQLTMEGQAAQYGATCDCYELTNGAGQNGSIWSPYSIDLTNSFDFTFQIYLGNNDGGADGLVFLLQTDPDGIGNIGYTIGYADPFGSANPINAQSLAIEIDTWNSAPTVASDIASDHVGLESAKSMEHNLGGPYPIANIEDGAWHTFQVIWDPALQIYTLLLDGTPIFAYNNDIVTNVFGGNPIVYFGWTSASGGAFNEHRVCAYRNVSFTADQNSVCPGTVINFTDNNSTSDLDGQNQIISYVYDYADGSPLDMNQNSSHAWTTPGTYPVTFTMTDLWNCPTTETINITILPDLIINADSVNVTCFGANDGQAIVNVLNGSGPYTYTWDDPGTQTTQTATGLGPSTYTVTAVDNLGCTGSGSVTVLEPTQLVIDSAVTTNASCGVNNGSITFYANGGTAPYQYSIDGGITFQNPTLFSNLAANNYNVEVIDNNGCSVTQVVTVNQNSPLVLDSLVVTDVTCGPPDGTITAYVSSGTMPYQYSIDGGTTYQNPNLFAGLTAGNYTVQIQDANNCIVSGNVTINSTTNLNIDNIIATDPSCNGGTDGTIEIIVSGGTPAYQYSIDGGTTFQGGSIFNNVGAGNYNVVIEDANTCQDNGAITVNEPTPVLIDNVTPSDATCFGSSDGSLEIFASGGTPGYTYSIDGGTTFQAGSLFSGILAGNYAIEVQDANGCPVTGNGIVGEPTQLIIDSIVVQDVTCNGLTDGGLTIYANQGTPGYQYSLDGITFQGSNTFSNLGSGPISVFVEDANGCPVGGNTTINESQPLIGSVGNDTTICENGTATLCAGVSGGTSPYSYTWNGTPGAVCYTTTSAGAYDMIVTDANGCTSAPVTQNVSMYPGLVAVVGPDQTICAGDIGQLLAEGAAGNGGPYTYIWTNNVDASTMNGPTQSLQVNTTTIYTVTVSDGCETTPVTGSITINTFPVPQILISADTTQGCEPVTVNFTSITDPTVVANTVWTYGTGGMGSGTTDTEIFDTPGCYDVNVEITTINNCVSDSTFTNFICVWEVPNAEFTFTPDDPDMFESEVYFANQSTGADNFQWFFGDGTDSQDMNPSHVFPEIGNVDYGVYLIAITDEGCSDTAYQVITVKEIILYYIPNAITANGDSFNELFNPIFVTGFVPDKYEFRIYNRWGELVWESYDYTAAWDGTYNGYVDDGVYTWQLIFLENGTDVKHQEFGHVTVLK